MASRYVIEHREMRPAQLSEDEVMTISEVAERLGLSTNAVGTMLRTGALRMVVDQEVRNPQHAQRALKVDVEKYAQEHRDAIRKRKVSRR